MSDGSSPSLTVAAHPGDLTITNAQRAALVVLIRTLCRPRSDVEMSMVDNALRLLEGRA